MSLVKSKQRVADHGEVFTPAWLVEDMLNLVVDEAARIDSRFLEPACGSGNFLVPILRRKLAAVDARYGTSDFEKRHHALLALMCIYGIELLPDNIAECRANVLEILAEYLNMDESDELYKADPLPRPYVLKPVNEGSSVGVAIVTADGNYGNPISADARGPWQEPHVTIKPVTWRRSTVALGASLLAVAVPANVTDVEECLVSGVAPAAVRWLPAA